MHFRIEIRNVQPIVHLLFELDLSVPRLVCIAGKNGAGKTTLAKSILNLAFADTFTRTSSEGIFNEQSAIHYSVGDQEHSFLYDASQRSLTTKTPIPVELKGVVSVEMPAPHGQRFTFFRTLAEADLDIRRAVILGQYRQPSELIEFLSKIYDDHRFDRLVEVDFRRGSCCCILKPDNRYIREDYFSSGEYFLINLFRRIATKCPLIFIDEIDISLDANTQARLANQLRLLCNQHRVTVIFTSHSLALMQTLQANELFTLNKLFPH